MLDMEAIKNFSIDKSGWKKVKFGDVVFEPKESVKDPVAEGIEHVVGLEHIESGDMYLRRSASIEESTTFTKKFSQGDVLFGRRRAYLKKAAKAEFEGICSGDITVMRPRKELLLPELLPFIVNNEKFFDHAITHSAGGLSPRVKFKDLANFAISLPSLEVQKKLFSIFASITEVVDTEVLCHKKIREAKSGIFIAELFEEVNKEIDPIFHSRRSKFKVELLGDLLTEIQYGISESLSELKNSGVPVLRMNNLQGGKLDLSDLKYFTTKGDELDRFILQKGDVLFNRTNSFELVGKVCLFDEDEKFSFASYLIKLKVDRELLDPRFLNFYLNSSIGLSKIRKYRTPGVSQSNINAQSLKKIPVPLMPIELQTHLMDRIENFQKSEENSNSKIMLSKKLQQEIINKVF